MSGQVIAVRAHARPGQWSATAPRVFFYLGCLTLPMLAIRRGLAISDVLFGLSAIARGLTQRSPLRRVPYAWKVATFLILLGAALAAPRADSDLGNYAVAARLAYILLVWPWTAFACLNSKDRLLTAMRLFVVGAGISGFVGLLELHGLHIHGALLQDGRAAGLTQHVNDQGAVLGAAVPIAFGLWLRRRRGTSDPMMLLSLAGILIGLVSSGSVSGMLAGSVGVSVLLARGRSVRTVIKSALVIVVSYYVGVRLLNHSALSPLGRLRLTTSSAALYGQNTSASRVETWQLAWHQILHNPFVGRGLDARSGMLDLPSVDGFTTTSLQTHNFILLAWYQGGLLTVIGVMTAVVYAFRQCWRRTNNLLAEVAFASFSASFVFALTGPVLFDRFFWFPAMLLLIVPTLPRADQTFRRVRELKGYLGRGVVIGSARRCSPRRFSGPR